MLKATEIMRESWMKLAPFAYERFLKRGRGGILVQAANLKGKPEGEGSRIDGDVKYVTAENMKFPDGIVREIEAYNPELEVIFIFDNGNELAEYRAHPADQPSPKALYEAIQNPH